MEPFGRRIKGGVEDVGAVRDPCRRERGIASKGAGTSNVPAFAVSAGRKRHRRIGKTEAAA